MKNLIGALMIIGFLSSCHESETVSEFTGNEAVYDLQQGSDFKVSGTATFKEKKDGGTLIIIELRGTEGDIQLPVHLHMGDISTPGAEVAALLNPVVASTGKSETNFAQLANESRISYSELIKLEASIKVHLSDVGPERDIILAGGNIGAIATLSSGRTRFGICESE